MYKIIKRAGDILFSTLGILFFLPFFIPLAIALKLTGEGYIFYLQERRGYKNKKFRIWKFATMLKASPSLGTGSLTVRNDPRVFPFGRFLRNTKINEMPQLLNILLGDMSVVGPRPQMEVDFKKFPDDVQEVIYDVVPGMTGIGSIVFRDEEKWITAHDGDKHVFYRDHIAPYKGELELWYQEHLTFRTDFMLVFLTAWTIIFQESVLVHKIFRDLPPRPENLA